MRWAIEPALKSPKLGGKRWLALRAACINYCKMVRAHMYMLGVYMSRDRYRCKRMQCNVM